MKLQCLQCGKEAKIEEKYKDLNVRVCENKHRTVDLDDPYFNGEDVAKTAA